MVRILSLSEKKFIESQRALGVSCQDISQELGIKVRLVYKWTALIKQGEMCTIQGRPAQGVGSSFVKDDKNVFKRIEHYRGLHPKWGAKTIQVELVEKDKYSVENLPSARTIERYLKHLLLTEVYEKHRPLAQSKRTQVEDCHDCWQMDDKGGEYYSGVGVVSMINVKDVKSCAHVQAFPLNFAHKRCHPNISDYQCALRLAFYEYGLPKRLQSDHGSNFHESKSQSPFPTPLHLWLLGLGVDLEWARIYRPTDQAKVERTHQTLHDQIQQTVDFKSWQDFKKTLDERRYRLNYQIDCDSLGKPPLTAFPKARHSGRFFNPLMEQELFDNKRIKHYLDKREWFRKISDIKTLSLGGHIYHLKDFKLTKSNRAAKIVFDAQTDNLIFYAVNELITQLPIKGLGFNDLVEPDFFRTLKNLQLELPFDWKTAKITTTF